MYGVSRSTFYKVINGLYKSNYFFNADEEKTILQFIKTRGLIGQPHCAQSLRIFAKELLLVKHEEQLNTETNPIVLRRLKEKKISEPSRKWVQHFLQRHQDQLINDFETLPKRERVLGVDNSDKLSAHSIHECQRCQKKEETSKTVWMCCSGQCGRWFHHSCVPELAHITKNVINYFIKPIVNRFICL